MSLQAGDTFFAPWPEPNGIQHLFFVISDPALDGDRVLVVPLMTWVEYKESTCTLEPDEHGFIRHLSYIDYGCARTASASYIEKQIECRKFRKHDPATHSLLEKIRKGADRSDFLELGYRDILENQGLVGPV